MTWPSCRGLYTKWLSDFRMDSQWAALQCWRRRAFVTCVKRSSTAADTHYRPRSRFLPPRSVNTFLIWAVPVEAIVVFITFCASRRRRKMYCGHARARARARVCVCVCLSAAVRPHYCMDPDVTWGRGRGCPLIVHYWADLQSVHRFRCYGNITRTLVYAGCARVAD